MRLSYEVVDVFTDRPFAGNPLAVVFGSADAPGGVDTAQFQAIAREFNLSETVFVLPPTVPQATYRVRIFTPTAELPFAGHPSVGAAVTQFRRGMIPAGPGIQECGAGLLPITVDPAGWAQVTGGEPTLSAPIEPGPLLAAVGLAAEDLAGPAPMVAGCGLPWPLLAVRGDAVARARSLPGGDLPGVPDVGGGPGLVLFAWDAEARTAHLRAFAPGYEDPATGSATLALGVYLVACGWLPGAGNSQFEVHQGAEIGRPSVLSGTVSAAAGQVVGATVGGQVFPVAVGEIAIPSPSA